MKYKIKNWKLKIKVFKTSFYLLKVENILYDVHKQFLKTLGMSTWCVSFWNQLYDACTYSFQLSCRFQNSIFYVHSMDFNI